MTLNMYIYILSMPHRDVAGVKVTYIPRMMPGGWLVSDRSFFLFMHTHTQPSLLCLLTNGITCVREIHIALCTYRRIRTRSRGAFFNDPTPPAVILLREFDIKSPVLVDVGHRGPVPPIPARPETTFQVLGHIWFSARDHVPGLNFHSSKSIQSS